MQKTKLTKALSLILCMVLFAAMALFTMGCTNDAATEEGTVEVLYEDGATLGEGETEFEFTVTDANGEEDTFIICTDEDTVGEALLDVNMIAGEAGDYGLYVKSVNGITADYDVDGTYWAFYVDGEYATSGVDTTEITEGSVYSFVVE